MKKFTELFSSCLQKRQFAPLSEILRADINAEVAMLGRKYEFHERESLLAFLGKLPAGSKVDFIEMHSDDQNNWQIKARMGLGMMKMASTWTIRLDADGNIAELHIS
jgi:hypothetical protein